MKNIAAAFVKAKRAFGPALKDKNNPHFKSKYADLASCIDSVDDALLANGIACIQETFEDATGVTVETVFLHESGESMRCGKLHVPAAKQDPQGYGSALTYARRYSLCAACGIAPEDDDGNAASKTKAAKPAVPQGPGGMSGADVKKAAYDALGTDWKTYIDTNADYLSNVFERQGAAQVKSEIDALSVRDAWENEHRLALEWKLPSNVRTALRAA